MVGSDKSVSSKVEDCEEIALQTVGDSRGFLTVMNFGAEIPFEIQRVYFLHHVPAGESRGQHAHRSMKQVLVCVSGSVEISLFDGLNSRKIILDSPTRGLYIPPMIWRGLSNFSNSCVVLSVVSNIYDEEDYIRDLVDFVAAAK